MVEIGKQLLMTRGALTTFSDRQRCRQVFRNYSGDFPASAYPGAARAQHHAPHTPHSAILVAVIFNALIIVALIPLALQWCEYRADRRGGVLRRNLLIYGVGGVIMPFVGIKLIDIILTLLGLA